MTVRLHTLFASLVLGTVALASAQPAFAYYVPGGSYVATCRHIHASGPYLDAVCRRVDGSWRYSHIFVDRCGGAGISNQDGHLSCGG
jgi:hypothetical protein